MSVFGVFLIRIQSENGKIRIRKTPITGTSHKVFFKRKKVDFKRYVDDIPSYVKNVKKPPKQLNLFVVSLQIVLRIALKCHLLTAYKILVRVKTVKYLIKVD